MIRNASIALFALISVAAAGEAHATEPTIAQIRDIESLLGLSAAIPKIVESVMPADAGERLTPEKRTCVVNTFNQALEERLQAALGRGFGTGETIEAWKAFDRTSGGHRMVELFGKTVSASLAGTPLPDATAEADKLTRAEQVDVVKFMGSPAGKVLEGELIPGFAASDEDNAAIARRVASTCGVSP